jgi:hypothetical protein
MNARFSIVVILAITAFIATAATTMVLNATPADAAQPRDCFHKGTGDELDSCNDEHGNNAISCNRGGQQCRD